MTVSGSGWRAASTSSWRSRRCCARVLRSSCSTRLIPRLGTTAIAADAGLRTIVDDLSGADDASSRRPRSTPRRSTSTTSHTSSTRRVRQACRKVCRSRTEGSADYLDFAVDAYCCDGEPPVVALHSALIFDLTITSLFLSFVTGGQGDRVRRRPGGGARADRRRRPHHVPQGHTVAARDLRPDGRHAASDPHRRGRR